jgi:ubiquinone/menaquinone biosynthesis C-methylase UbiE
MQRIEQEAGSLRGKHLLEIGCGMGYDSLEFLKRGVRVTATDLTENAVRLARRHFELEQVAPESVHTENALALSFPNDTFDAVWSNGVLHATGDTRLAVQEARRVLRTGGRAIISHFYRKPSWMYAVSRLGREPIEGFQVINAVHEHHRALPIAKSGIKARLYNYGFKPLYNLLPEPIALKFAYKLSVTAIKI